MTERAIVIHGVLAEDAPAIARVHVDTWRAAYSGIVPDAALAKMSCEVSARRQLGMLCNEHCASFIALKGAQVTGFSMGGPIRDTIPGYHGEIY